MKRSTPKTEATRPPRGLFEQRGNPFSIERVSVPKPASMENHHYHNYYELYYLYSGNRYYFIKDKTYHVKRGTLVLVKPYEIHSTINYDKSSYDRCLVTFRRSFVAEQESLIKGINLFSCFENDIHLISLGIQEQSFVEGLLFSMESEFQTRAQGYEAILKTAMTQLLLIIARHASESADIAVSVLHSAHKTVSEIAAYINNSYKEEITLATISETFFISPCYFSRIFKRITGISFTEYLNGVRIKEGQHLLATTDSPISDIAEAVGYKSATHFGRKFNAITGMSPSEYRRVKRGSNR